MYIIYDEVPDTVTSKERESCFTSGSNDEKLAQYITDNRSKHFNNVSALRTTIGLFDGDEPKRRLHGKVTARLEQERKWVKHYDICINEHKKGLIIARLKATLETTRKDALKRDRDARADHERKMEELRKHCRVQFRKEWDDEIKAKKKNKKTKHWYDWIVNLFKDKTDNEENPVTPAKMVAKELVTPGGMSARQKREFYMARRVAANNN